MPLITPLPPTFLRIKNKLLGKPRIPRRQHPLTLAVGQVGPRSRPHKFTPSPRQNPFLRILTPRAAATSSRRQNRSIRRKHNRRTKGDHAGFGELSLPDGPNRAHSGVPFPSLYPILPGVAGRNKMRKMIKLSRRSIIIYEISKNR
jgi:hypothetical protein